MLTDINERVDPNHKWSKLKSIGLVESVRIGGMEKLS